jgi:hypothetical protein
MSGDFIPQARIVDPDSVTSVDPDPYSECGYRIREQ